MALRMISAVLSLTNPSDFQPWSSLGLLLIVTQGTSILYPTPEKATSICDPGRKSGYPGTPLYMDPESHSSYGPGTC